ncbi:MAG: phage holin family protein [Pseudomonadota bacterium]
MLESEQDSETEGEATSAAFQQETIVEELGSLIDDAQLYAKAELAFQKTRARLVGRNVGAALGAVIVAIILLHIALIALAVGLVLALEPVLTIWGAIGIVVGVMLLGVGLLGRMALARAKRVGAMFETDPDTEADGAAQSGNRQ